MANTATALRHQFGLDWQSPTAPEMLPSGIEGIQLPRGCLTEIFGAASTGRTTVRDSILAAATARGETCAVVDADSAFDPVSAAAAGVCLDRLVWVACAPLAGRHAAAGANSAPRPGRAPGDPAEHALKAADLLVQGGGFGVVVLDLGDAPPESARRISLTSWFRLRRAVEHTPTVLLALARQSNAKTCASLQLECRQERAQWSGARPGRLFRGFQVRATLIERGPWHSGSARPARRPVSITGKHDQNGVPGSNACSPVFTAAAI